MNAPDESAASRRNARREWPVVKMPLTQEQPAARVLAPEQALASMWQLALDAWAMTNRPLPDYSRAETPVRRLAMESAAPERSA